ncbi:hypothetical protein DL762_004827 [Monosporascus cannonballus]|uniref:Phosphatidylinositol N-acetylglucosaminyltransferase subunit H conserved domain-containing protein n=1 Tax=Monosporascus cannonballus TaxID=155416 RepID=A0ABY0H7Q9_9PEZI|nr:hypothetical protein DL762_004827 [Monosporascus cannonballus]RYO93182.1 hypothetical protein DL763_004454 [Monosporascus cannonballus]
MLTTKPYLRIRRPSPTTAEFIVSTRPPLTPSLRILLCFVYLIRLVAGLEILLLLYSTWTLSPYSRSSPSTNGNSTTITTTSTPLLSLAALHNLLHAVQTTALGRLSARVAAAVPARVLAPGGLAALYLVLLRIHTEERLLVLRGLGIQTTTPGGATVLARATTRFIPTGKIRDVLINEAFRGFEVRHYLVVVVEGEDDVVVVFPRLLPRPRILEKVWRGVRGCLFEYDGKAGMNGEGRGR